MKAQCPLLPTRVIALLGMFNAPEEALVILQKEAIKTGMQRQVILT